MLSDPSKYFEVIKNGSLQNGIQLKFNLFIKVDPRVMQYSNIFNWTLDGDPTTDPVYAKIERIFKEIQKSKKFRLLSHK